MSFLRPLRNFYNLCSPHPHNKWDTILSLNLTPKQWPIFSIPAAQTVAQSLHCHRNTISDMYIVSPFMQQQRFYNRKKTIKLPPTKPLSFAHHGDVVQEVEPLNLAQPRLEFENVHELKHADDTVQKLFSLSFGDGGDRLKKRVTDCVRQIQLHSADTSSLEIEIAVLTVHIRTMIQHCLTFRKDKRNKTILLRRIGSRRKKLEELRELDYERFEWITKQLGLEYKTKSFWDRKLSKRATRKKAARDKYLAIKKQKLEDFRNKLAEDRVKFDQIKEEELKKIEAELSELCLTDTHSLQETFESLKLGKPFAKERKPYTTCRRQRLEMKFALYADRRRKSLEGTQAEEQTF